MLFFYLLIGYLIGSIPGITFFADNLDNFKKKTMVIPKKGITVSFFPAFSWQWAFFTIDFFKFLYFYYMLTNSSFVWIFGITLGHIFPIWKPTLQRSVLFFLLGFVYQTNLYLFWLLVVIEIAILLYNKELKEIPLIVTSFLLSIFFWVSGADIYYVLVSLLFFGFSLLGFFTVNKKYI
ncbi:MAG: hypothetical protein WCH76_00935 [Candidatus Riflemargulisbacteria bacterium]